MEGILGRLRSLPPVKQRRAACVLGAIVADVAITPLHWIYDQEKVAKLVSAGTVEFSPTSHCPFYTVAAGEPSAYGSQLMLVLEGLAKDDGFSVPKMADRFFKHFGDGTIYDMARRQSSKPVKGPWTNHSIKIFLAKREEGDTPESDTNSKDPDGLVKAIDIVGMYHGRPEMFDRVKECVQITQSNAIAVGYALAGARILSHVISTSNDALDEVTQQLKSGPSHPYETDLSVAKDMEDAKSATGKPHTEAVKQYGMACSMPGLFKGIIHGIAVATDYKTAIRNEILAAGDSCGRVPFIGAYMAAKYGLDSIPVEWIQKVNGIEGILANIEKIVQQD